MTNTTPSALTVAATALVERYDRMSEVVREDLCEAVPGLLGDLDRLAAALDAESRAEFYGDRPSNLAARKLMR